MRRVPDPPRPDRAIGLFETLLVLDGSPIELERHLERLGRSVRELFGQALPADARELALERAAPLQLGRLRLTVAPREDDSLAAAAVAAFVDTDDLFPSWERAIALRPFVLPGGLGEHKWADRERLAWAEAGEPEGWLPLVLDVGEEALEASRANVFAVEDGVLVTPAADGRILPGVARARAIEIAGALGIEVREERLDVERLIVAGEAFLTGSVRGIEPVSAVGETALGPPGELLAELSSEMRRSWMDTRTRSSFSVRAR
jgi:para-aminobenzoate synthetase/4-amino-4-deoxychorismate lyase